MPEPTIKLLTNSTPNGYPISIALEELGVPYEVQWISFDNKDQKKPEFLALNPNGRIPVIVDHKNDETPVFETIAILQYLADLYDPEGTISYKKEKDPKLYYEQLQWLAWAQGGLGPMQGQANHFVRYAPEDILYAKKRYVDESRRLYGILEERLGRQEWLVGSKYTIADIKAAGWAFSGPWPGVTNLDFTEPAFPNIKKWLDRIKARPASDKGLAVPKRTDEAERIKNADKHAAEARKNFDFKS